MKWYLYLFEYDWPFDRPLGRDLRRKLNNQSIFFFFFGTWRFRFLLTIEIQLNHLQFQSSCQMVFVKMMKHDRRLNLDGLRRQKIECHLIHLLKVHSKPLNDEQNILLRVLIIGWKSGLKRFCIKSHWRPWYDSYLQYKALHAEKKIPSDCVLSIEADHFASWHNALDSAEEWMRHENRHHQPSGNDK